MSEFTSEMRQAIEGRGERKLSAYFFGFKPTGDEDIDLILGAVALAGKAAHSTEWWSDDEMGGAGWTFADLIQAAANHAARRGG